MMFSESSLIPLYFDESEADLWLALQQIEPLERIAFIKATLRQVLLIPTDITKINSEHEQPKDHVDALKEEIEPYSLEALFTGASEPDAEYEGFSKPEESKLNSLREPWDHLINAVIGQEEDIVVINAILQAVQFPEEQDDQLDNIPKEMKNSKLQADELNFESLKVDVSNSSTGFEYMMKHIIGTEEDEVVLKILRGGPEAQALGCFGNLKEE